MKKPVIKYECYTQAKNKQEKMVDTIEILKK